MSEPTDDKRAGVGRGPAYPFIGLAKAIERVEQIRDQNMLKIAAAPIDYYKSWQYSGESGNARQTLAALNQYGLVEYVGRGDQRQVRLSELARRIVLDQVPNSPERAAAIRSAALAPTVHLKLWEKYGAAIPPEYVLQTFLTRDGDFNLGSVANVISVYRDTFDYAGLGEPIILPESGPQDATNSESELAQVGSQSGGPGISPVLANRIARVLEAPTPTMMAPGLPFGENEIKIMLDGDLLRVSAVVDLKGAKKLLKALKANMALLEDDEDDDSDLG